MKRPTGLLMITAAILTNLAVRLMAPDVDPVARIAAAACLTGAILLWCEWHRQVSR